MANELNPEYNQQMEERKKRDEILYPNEAEANDPMALVNSLLKEQELAKKTAKARKNYVELNNDDMSEVNMTPEEMNETKEIMSQSKNAGQFDIDKLLAGAKKEPNMSVGEPAKFGQIGQQPNVDVEADVQPVQGAPAETVGQVPDVVTPQPVQAVDRISKLLEQLRAKREEGKAGIEDALREQRASDALAMISEGAAQMGAGIAGTGGIAQKADLSTAKAVREQAKRGVETAQAKYKLGQQESKDMITEAKLGSDLSKLDPTSRLSQQMQKLVKEKLGDQFGDVNVDAMSYNELKDMLNVAKPSMTEYQRERLNEIQANRGLRQEQKLDRDVEKISTRLEKSGLIDRKRAMEDIDQFLSSRGWDITDPKKKGKDIAGIGFAASWRPDILTPKEDVNFRQNVQGLANQLLKARSGAAVTDQEYRRFLKEIGSGDFSSETDLVAGLRKMREDINNNIINIVKSADPNAQTEYLERTGLEDLLLKFREGKGGKKPTSVVSGTDRKIDIFMKNNPSIKSKDEARKILKDAGKI